MKRTIYILQTFMKQPICIHKQEVFMTPEVQALVSQVSLLQLPMAVLTPTAEGAVYATLHGVAVFCYTSLEDLKRVGCCKCGAPDCVPNNTLYNMVDYLVERDLQEVSCGDVVSDLPNTVFVTD